MVDPVEKAFNIGKEEGLNFIYKGNLRQETKTTCPKCGKDAIIRNNHIIKDFSPEGTCKNCGRDLNIVADGI